VSPETKSIPFSGIDKQRLGAPRNSSPSKSSAVAQQAGRGARALSLSLSISCGCVIVSRSRGLRAVQRMIVWNEDDKKDMEGNAHNIHSKE
jgi:hypothetical protein